MGILNAEFLLVIPKNEHSLNIKTAVREVAPRAIFLEIDYVTEGPVCSALLFREYINNDDELIIANCDQIMEWNAAKFLHNAMLYDGCVVTYHADTPKNSYALLSKHGLVTEIKEKEVISNVSLNGIHYWKKGKFFVDSADAMIKANDRAKNGEFYIGPSYNYMIRNKLAVGIYHIPNQQHHAIGTPEDLNTFLEYEKTAYR